MPSNRTCGSCTACCKTHPILALNNPAGVWCKHCEIGTGCRIYRTRPQECKDFQCDWLLGLFEPEERPDLVNVVVGEATLPGFGPMPALYEVSQWGLNGPFARKITSQFIGRGSFVCHLPLVSVNKIYIPPKRITVFPVGQYFSRINGRETEIVRYVPGQ